MKAFTIPDEYRKTIPQSVQDGLLRYVNNGVMPGDFLRAVLQNDLRLTFRRADEASLAALWSLVQILDQLAPSDCWGSSELVTRWVLLKEREAQKAKVAK